MTGCWFTYGRDALPLIQSVKAFRKAGGTNVAIFDDGASPLPDETIRAINPDLRRTTTFNRRGNLRGWDWVFGQLECLEGAARAFDADEVIKIDSDTLVLDLDWIAHGSPLCGFHITGNPYVFGMAYMIAMTAIWDIRRELEDGYHIPDAKVEEDTVITTEALALYGRQVRRINWNRGLAGGWDYGKSPLEKYFGCSVVTFGNRKHINGCGCEDEKREAMAMEMARFIKGRNVKGDSTTPAP